MTEIAETERILSRQFHGETGAEAWRVLPEGASASFRTASFGESVRFVQAINGLVGGGAPPDVDIRRDGVSVLIRAFKGEDYGLVKSDLDLARAISTTAGEMGLTAEPAVVQSLLIDVGATDRPAIMPFWLAVLAYDPRPDSPDEDLIDPHDRLAPISLVQMDEPRADGGGTLHLAVWLPWDEAESRVAAGVAAGGRIVRHNAEDNLWTLADAAGNEVDIWTTSAPDQAV